MLVVGNILGRKTGGDTGGISFPLLKNTGNTSTSTEGDTSTSTIQFDVSNFSTLSFEKVGFENSYNNHVYIYGDDTKIYEKSLQNGTNESVGDTLDISSYAMVKIELYVYHTTQTLPVSAYLKGVTIS